MAPPPERVLKRLREGVGRSDRLYYERGEPDECWPWLMYVIHADGNSSQGYGGITWVENGKTDSMYAHRAMYIAFKGDPGERVIDHMCRNRSCVNPGHLRAMSTVENSRENRFYFLTACLNGHEFTPENTYFKRRGPNDERVRRGCRTCDRKRKNAAYAKKRATA